MRYRIIHVLLVFACLLMAAPLAAAPAQAAPAAAGLAQSASGDLPGTSWTLSSLNGQLPLPGTTVTLVFGTDGTVSGSDGCNRFSTTYTNSGSTIRIRPVAATTMMACPPPVAQQATAYMQALVLADKYEVRSSMLTLFDGSKVLATFVSAGQGLEGTDWQVTAYNNGRNAVVSVQVGTELTAAFGEDGIVSGSGGCNDYFADYTAADGKIAIGPVGATFRMCPEPNGVMEQEAEYLAALASAVTYKVEGNFLDSDAA